MFRILLTVRVLGKKFLLSYHIENVSKKAANPFRLSIVVSRHMFRN